MVTRQAGLIQVRRNLENIAKGYSGDQKNPSVHLQGKV